MVHDYLAFRRRSIHERKAIRLMRGEAAAIGANSFAKRDSDHPKDDETLSRYRIAQFGCLREFCRRNGLTFMPRFEGAGSQSAHADVIHPRRFQGLLCDDGACFWPTEPYERYPVIVAPIEVAF